MLTLEDNLLQELSGFARIAGSLNALETLVGNEAPNLALSPSKLALSSPFTQFFILTCKHKNIGLLHIRVCIL